MTTAPLLESVAVRPRISSKLYRDAASLATSSMLTAVLGIAFWAVSAKLIKPSELGVQTAVMSIILAPAIVIASGVGDAFTALVPVSGAMRRHVVARGYRILVTGSVALGVIAAGVAITVLPQVRGSIPVAGLIVVGVVIWSLFVVQDSALTSLRRAHWLPIENGSVSLAKTALLPVGLAVGIGAPVVVATLLPSVVAIFILLPRVRKLSSRPRPGNGSVVVAANPVRELPRLVIRTTTSIALSLGTLTLTPFIVTASAGPSQGAVFSLGLSIVQSLDFVGAALGVSLVVHASGAGDASTDMARVVFLRAVAVVGVGGIALIAIAPLALRLLNPGYLRLHGFALICTLVAGSAIRVGYVIWAALQRARRQMTTLLLLNAAGAIFVFAVMPIAATRWGAVGAGIVVAAAQAILSLGAAVSVLARRLRRVSND